jgi:2-polyprenyl-3-methyl-5-hydroxy-6-metoxy-1,4-benzoquinol methylase
MNSKAKTTHAYWEAVHSSSSKSILPSNYFPGSRNILKQLRRHIKPGMDVLEIGCAPGGYLAYVAGQLRARVSGVDYSEQGISAARSLFEKLHLQSDLRCEDIEKTTFKTGTFDFVYSNGVIEHFTDPAGIVRRHVDFLKPGGIALILIPNYGGMYGKVQRYFDPDNLLIHNLNIMSLDKLLHLSPSDLAADAAVYPAGRINPWLISFHKKWPPAIVKAVNYFFYAAGTLQPFDIPAICPMLALKMTRALK